MLLRNCVTLGVLGIEPVTLGLPDCSTASGKDTNVQNNIQTGRRVNVDYVVVTIDYF